VALARGSDFRRSPCTASLMIQMRDPVVRFSPVPAAELVRRQYTWTIGACPRGFQTIPTDLDRQHMHMRYTRARLRLHQILTRESRKSIARSSVEYRLIGPPGRDPDNYNSFTVETLHKLITAFPQGFV
jgi:hypothetical protein